MIWVIIFGLWTLGILGYILRKKINTPSLPNSIPDWLSLRLIAIVVFLIALAMYFPGFSAKAWQGLWELNGRTLFLIAASILLVVAFWDTVKGALGCLIPLGGLLLLGLIIFLLLRNGCNKSSDSAGKSEVNIVVWKIISSTDSTVVYNGPTPWEGGAYFRVRVTPECGKSVSVDCSDWNHQIILTGCNPATQKFPRRHEGKTVKVSAVK